MGIKFIRAGLWASLMIAARAFCLDGPQLLLNGDAEQGSNLNFPSAAYSRSNCYAGNGCFEVRGNVRARLEQKIAIDPRKFYRFSVMVQSRGNGGSSKAFVGFDCLDSAGNSIGKEHYYQPQATQTTLARELKNGDTRVYLTSAANWDIAESGRNRFLAVFDDPNYNNAINGRYYYTRKVAAYTASDTAANTVTLSTPWEFGAVAAGTAAASTWNVATAPTFQYPLLNGELAPASWMYRAATLHGVSKSGGMSAFKPGTAAIAPIVLANYGQTSAYTLAMDNFYLNEILPPPGFETASIGIGIDEKAQVIYVQDKSNYGNLTASITPLATITTVDSEGRPSEIPATSLQPLGGNRYVVGFSPSQAQIELRSDAYPDHLVIRLEAVRNLPERTIIIKFFELKTPLVAQHRKDQSWADAAADDAIFLYTLALNNAATGQRYYDDAYTLSAGAWEEPPGGRTFAGAAGILVTSPKRAYLATLQKLIDQYRIPEIVRGLLTYRTPRGPVVWDHRYSTSRNTPVTITLKGYSAKAKDLTFRVTSSPYRKGTIGPINNTARDSATVVYTPPSGLTNSTDWFTFRAHDGALDSAGATILILVNKAAEAGVLSPRTPQWPLKTSSIMYSNDEISRVRDFCAHDALGRKIVRSLQEQGAVKSPYGMSERPLQEMIMDWSVPRGGMDFENLGCPIHGTAIKAAGGFKLLSYPLPVVTCPIGGERYPDNDYFSFYLGAKSDPLLLGGRYADAGRGYARDDGKKHWFAAEATAKLWNSWIAMPLPLAQVYVATGDESYAHKAAVILDRFAALYPNMRYPLQSEYGDWYGQPGKIGTCIWDSKAVQSLPRAYDLIFPYLAGPHCPGIGARSAIEVRRNIEANLLEEIIDGVRRGEILGNYGLTQNVMAGASLVRQNGPVAADIDYISNGDPAVYTSGYSLVNMLREGLQYALYNFIFKDGIGYEGSMSYNSGWVNELRELALLKPGSALDLFASAKFRRVLDAHLDLIAARSFTPNTGDAGSINSKLILPSAATYEAAYRRYGDARYAWAWSLLETIPATQRGFGDLFKENIFNRAAQDARAYLPRSAARFFDGAGIAIINNSSDTSAISMTYGPSMVHGHHDALNIEPFAYGRRLAPDLGYPDEGYAYDKGRNSWSNNTVSHNTLVVDRRKQTSRNSSGTLLRMHDAEMARVVDVEVGGRNAYNYAIGDGPQTPVYRRTLVQVDVDAARSYFVDVFRVRGGTQEYLLSTHAHEANFRLHGASLSPAVTTGTLAGAHVREGEYYDDPNFLPGGKYYGSTNYHLYTGSGYQHFLNWQKAQPSGVAAGEWEFFKVEGLPDAALRIHVMPHAAQEIIVADAYASPKRKIPAKLKYMLIRRAPHAQGDVFVTLWEPYALNSGPSIERIEPIAHEGGAAATVALRVIHRDGSHDVLVVAPGAGASFTVANELETDAAVAVARRQADRWRVLLAAGGNRIANPSLQLRREIAPPVRGVIESVDYAKAQIVLSGVTLPAVENLRGKTARIFNERHSCAYRIEAASLSDGKLRLTLGGADLRTGRFRVSSVDGAAKKLRTNNYLLFPLTLAGMRVATEDFSAAARIESVSSRADAFHTIALSPDAQTAAFTPASNVWIMDFGWGDTLEIESAIASPAEETPTPPSNVRLRVSSK